MRKPIKQRIRELEEQKKALQSRLEKQQRAETTRRKMLPDRLFWNGWSRTEMPHINREGWTESS